MNQSLKINLENLHSKLINIIQETKTDVDISKINNQTKIIEDLDFDSLDFITFISNIQIIFDVELMQEGIEFSEINEIGNIKNMILKALS
tara:strand:- start:1656 stop:1925 length:270 start_codon:yes stop_codon:yes gene_type:complete